MGIFDWLLSDHPAFWWRRAQTHAAEWSVPVEDTYGDTYHLDATGRLWRLTDNAAMRASTWDGVRANPYRLPAPAPLAFSGWIDAAPDEPRALDRPYSWRGRALLLVFRDGVLVGARDGDWTWRKVWPRPRRHPLRGAPQPWGDKKRPDRPRWL